MKPRHLAPPAAHVVITSVIGFGQVIPGSCIEGVNALTIGFAASIAGTVLAYLVGVRLALRDAGLASVSE